MATLRNEFSWSHARDACFRACPRQYFFHYYGAWGGWERGADAKARTLYILRQLQTRHQWMGATVHNAIRWVLATLRAKGALPDEELVLRHLGRRMQRDFEESGEGLYWENPKEHVALIEHEYDDLDVPDGAWAELVERALRCLGMFYQSEVLRALQELPAEDWLQVEDRASLQADGLKIWVQLDCAVRAGGGVRVFDWKTGKADVAATHHQLDLYAAFASQRWQVTPEAVSTAELNLGDGVLYERAATAALIEAALARARASAESMRALLDDPAANTASEERFAMSGEEGVCLRCPFRRVCPRWVPAAGASAGDADT